MTKQKWLVALMVGSSIGCVCDAHWSSAQSTSGLSYRMQVLVNPEGGLANPLSINNRDWVAGAINPSDDIIGHPGLWRRNADSQSGKPSWRMTDLGTLGGANAEVHSPNKNEIGWLAGNSDTATTDLKGENFCGWVCAGHGCPTTINVCQGFLWRQETNKMIALPPIAPIPRCETQFN